MSKKPNVVIVGRMNVGKSTLFNRLSGAVKSITLDYAGVTRDFIKDTVFWNNRSFNLIDTGGISLRKTQDVLLEKTRQVALQAVQDAAIVLFLVDGSVGIVVEDREIAKLLHKLGKKVITIVNKMDRKDAQEAVHEFRQLGFSAIIPVSAEHNRGIGDVLEQVTHLLPEGIGQEEEDLRCKVVLLGKPNVGKSSLMNLLLNKERSIVTDIPGTTREALSETISFYQEDIQVTDTPGIRKKRAIDENIEELMVKSSMRALSDADVILLLVDAAQGKISDQELKLAFYAFTQRYKALILLFNKQDLVTEQTKEDLAFSLEEYEYLTKRVPQLSISCISGKNVGKVLPLVKQVCERYKQQFSNQEIFTLFKQELTAKPLHHKTYPLLVQGVEQIKTGPITLVLKVNEPKWFEKSQLQFFENLLRKTYDLKGVPVKFIVRKGR